MCLFILTLSLPTAGGSLAGGLFAPEYPPGGGGGGGGGPPPKAGSGGGGGGGGGAGMFLELCAVYNLAKESILN